MPAARDSIDWLLTELCPDASSTIYLELYWSKVAAPWCLPEAKSLPKSQRKLPFRPGNASEAGALEWTFLFVLGGGLEAMVCLLVVEDSWLPADGASVEVVPLLTVLVVVWRLKVAETADLVATVLSCEADFKEVWDVDFFILGGSCNERVFIKKMATSNKLHGLLR